MSVIVAAPMLFQMSARAADPVISDPSKTSLGVITGGDPGEGLDLTGNFIYALSFGANPENSFQVQEANFKGLLSNEVPGATLVAGNRIENWYVVDFGDSPDDDSLEAATSSIRWSDAAADPNKVTLTLENLLVGAEYKLQLIFGEQCCDRGFDVFVDGGLIVKDFNPGRLHDGFGNGLEEALITHTLTTTKNTLQIVLDGTGASPDYPDHNAIFNALTVEQISAPGDSDNDGLPDAWEQLYFKNLDQTASGDPDNDGLTNAEEVTAGTDPTKPDTDGDGLTDSQEVKTYKTNPTKADTDGDGLSDSDEVTKSKTDPTKADTDGDRLSDGTEVNVTKTDPLKADTDGDGVSDFDELRVLTDPTNKDSVSKTTSVGGFTGGDPGEGLDLQGNLIYAFSIGSETPAGLVGDADFTGETVDGATIEQADSIIEGWYVATFGDTVNDAGLAQAVSSIRHGGGGAKITLDHLEAGATYKLQLLFGEVCCNRGMDIQIDGRQIVDEFAPYVYQGGINNPKQGAVVTYSFVARKTSVEIRTVGATVTTPEYTDRNPIINAVTLEKVLAPADTDNDGLPDEWERLNFGDLSQTAGGDPDGDGLTHAQEFAQNTDPNNEDTDGDTLSDGQEVNVLKTNPFSKDTDGDGLSDADEVNVYKTDPTNGDGDGDGLPDGLEIISSGPVTKVSNVVVQAFTGGDPGEGLDLQGNFRYAFNVSSAGAAGKAGDADFTADTAPGITVIAPNNIPNWDMPEYGDSEADNVIEKVTQSIRYGSTMQVILADLIPGSTYRLQMLFYEQCCGTRGFNIYADGELVTSDFSPPVVQEFVNNTAEGAMVSADIETQRDKMTIILTTSGRTDPTLTDPNAILDGVTLEVLKQGPVQTKPTLTLNSASNGQITITTDGTLQAADTVDGSWQSLPDKSVTLDPKAGGKQKFYRATR